MKPASLNSAPRSVATVVPYGVAALRPDDRHRPLGQLGQMTGPAQPQTERHAAAALHLVAEAEVTEPVGPLVVAGHHESSPAPGGPRQHPIEVEVGSPLRQTVTEPA